MKVTRPLADLIEQFRGRERWQGGGVVEPRTHNLGVIL
jgi:hypothetical protein